MSVKILITNHQGQTRDVTGNAYHVNKNSEGAKTFGPMNIGPYGHIVQVAQRSIPAAPSSPAKKPMTIQELLADPEQVKKAVQALSAQVEAAKAASSS